MTNVVGYVPHSDTTRHHYERLLHDLRRCLPPGSDGQMEGVAEELLDIVCGGASHGVSVQQQHLQLEHLLNVKLTREQEDRLLQYGRLITDYVVTADNRSGRLEEKDNNIMPLLEEAPSSSSGGDSSSDDDDDAGVITALTGGTHKKRSKKSRKHRADQKDLAQFAFSAPDDDGGMGEDRGDNEFGEDDGDDEMMDMTFSISFDEVACNPDYVHDALRRHFPSQSSDTCTAQAGRVLQFLNVREVDALTLETQLTAFLGGYEDEGVMQWISDVAASRWCIVYGLQYALATTQKAKEQVMNDMRTHAEEDVVVERLYQNITGKEIGLVKKRNKAGENEEETEAAADDERPLRKVDLQSSSFADERTPHQHVQARVPAGTQRVAYETHDEVVLPPPPRSTREGETLVPITEFPLWATKAFAGVTQLNPMQSKVYSTAFLSDENMLVCAPTGAGKTNVAMMAMLRCIQNAMNPDGSIQLHQLKMVYVAPMKALVQEVVRTFSKRLEPLGLAVAELSGDSSMTQKQMAETQLLVTTPEKWDVITRKSVELGVASLLKLLILDEVHLLHNDRGPVLEAIVARTMLQQQLRGEEGIRIVGLSATLPNYHDVATFLQVDRQRGLHVFDASYRPIPLQQTFCAAKKIKGVTQPTVMNRVVYDKVLQAAQDNEQTMIFVHSRRDTEHTAQYMKQRVQEEHRNHFIVQPNSESERVLRAIIEDGSVVLRRSLQQLLPYGFAIHHAGLSRDERQTVEKLFEERHIRVLVCTSTLAWGVNLPANQVIIKGTRVFDGSTSQLLSALDVLQMFGRAGRVGFGASLGRAAIVTSPEDLHYYLGILSSQLPIESQMMKRLVDMMNAEITLGHIESTKEGVRWLQRTYLYVRMRASPEKYGIRPSAGDPLLLHHLENIVHTACEDLKTSSMAEYMYPQSRKVGSTPYGRIASYYYVTAASMSIYLNKLSNCMKDEDLFRLFSMSSEFSHISARADEQAQLAELLEVVPIAVRESRYSPMAKINVLLQCFISRLSLEGLPLMSELVYVKDSAQRILRALYDICMVREYCRTAQQFLELFQMVVHRQWNVESPLRQVREVVSDKVLDSLLPTLERVRVPWEEVRLWSLEDLVDKLGDERRAGVALECIQRTPHFVLDYTAVRPLTRSLLYVDVDLHGDFRYDPVAHGNTARELLLTVELPNCRLLHQETILLPLAAIGLDEGTESFSCPPLVVPMVEPRPTHLILRLTSPMWLHAQTSKAICLLNLPLPPLAPALRETHMRAATANGGASEDMDVLSVLAPYRLEASAGKLFPFTDFFAHQRELVEPILDGNHENLFAGIPPGGGKTVVAELFVLSFLLEQALEEDGEQPSSLAKKKLLYITCHDDVATRRLMDWKFKFGELLQQKVVGLDGTALHNPRHLTELEEATIIVTTGAHLVRCLRSASASKVCQSVTHIVADHLHLLRDVEGRHVEESLARLNTAPFLVNGGTSRARLLALSYPLISPLEVCRWLRISSSMQFNFGLSYRSNQVRMVGMDAPGLRSRQEASVMAALKLLQRAPYSQQSCLVFVASRRQAEEVAKRVIVKCRDFVPETPVASVEDARLGLLLSAGVGYLHQCVSDLDVLALLEALDQPAVHPLTLAPLPLVLVCTFDAANRLPAGVTSNAIVCVPERPRGIGDSVSTDCTATEVQSMTSRAVREAVVYCRLPRRWVLGQLLNEPLPLECSMRYPEDFRSIVNAAVADGRVKNKIDVLRVLQTHYFLYHLKSHLAFYGVPPEDGIQAYASNFAFSVVHALQERKCLWIEGEADGEDDPHALLHVTPRGRAMALYDMDFDSMETVLETVAELQESGRLSSMGALWSCVCMGCVELTSRYLGEAVRLGDEAEANALRTIARALPSSFGVKYMDLDFSMEQTKVYILTLSHCARFWNGVEPSHPATRNASHPLSSPDHVTEGDAALLCAIAPTTAMKLDEDRRLILPQVMRTLEALTSILDGSHGSVGVSLLMELSQCIRRGVWSLEDHPLLQLSTLQRDLPQTLAITPSVLMKSMLQGSPSLTVDGLQTATTAPAIVRAVEKLLERHPNSNRGMTSNVVLKKLRADAAGIPCVRSIEAKGSMEELVEGGEMVVVLSVHAELTNYISPTPSEEAPATSEIAENCAERWWLRCSLRPKARGSTRSEKEEKLLVVDTAVATTSVVKSEPLALISAQTRFPVSLLESEADLDSVEVVVHLHHFVFQVQAEAVASFDG